MAFDPYWLDRLWRLLAIVGLIALVMVWRHARTIPDPLARARRTALALGLSAFAIWCSLLLDELLTELFKVNGPPAMIVAMRLAWMAVAFGGLLFAPAWVPRLLLIGRPGRVRLRLVAMLGRLVLAILAVAVIVTGFVLGFASSAGAWLRAVVTESAPLLVLALLAMTMSAAAREAGGRA